MRRSCWLAVVGMGVLSGAQGEDCPKAVSIYAMQKTGSTFLGLFSRSVALRQVRDQRHLARTITPAPSPLLHACRTRTSLQRLPRRHASTRHQLLATIARHQLRRQQMCKVLQTTKEFVCESVDYVDCPRNALHRKSVHLERAFAPPSRRRQGWDCGPPELVGPKGHAQWRCKPDGGPEPGVGELRRRCNDQLRHEMFAAANGWLRSTTDTPKYRWHFSLARRVSDPSP